MTAKTLANHRSNVKAALLWVAGERDLPGRGARLSLDWMRLRDLVDDEVQRYHLTGLMRFLSAQAIGPGAVSDEVVKRYLAHRALVGQEIGPTVERKIARAWNACAGRLAGWPAIELTAPPVRSRDMVPWEDFPERLQRDVDAYSSPGEGAPPPRRDAAFAGQGLDAQDPPGRDQGRGPPGGQARPSHRRTQFLGRLAAAPAWSSASSKTTGARSGRRPSPSIWAGGSSPSPGAGLAASVDKAIGLRVTPHQFTPRRAAAIILKNHPGAWEFVRQVLGRKSLRTTMNFYVGLETMEANRLFFGEIIRRRLDELPEED